MLTTTLTPGVWSVTVTVVFTCTSVVSPMSVQAVISTSSSAPDTYAGRASIPCVGFTFTAAASDTVSTTRTRVFASTTNHNIYLLMSANFSSGTMNASGSSGMSITRIA